MAKEKIIGIDLGTTNSCVAVVEGTSPAVIPNSEGKRTTPSMVAFLNGGQGERKVGEPAKRQAITNPTHTITSIKRFMGKEYAQGRDQMQEFSYELAEGKKNMVTVRVGERGYTPQELSAMILQKMKAAAEAYLGGSVKKAVITVPAYFNDVERQATKEAGQIAGLEVMRIINEPTAAALSYGLDKKDKDLKVAVFDLGGGTFDISILEVGGGVFEVRATNGDLHMGGDNFDKVLIDHLADTFQQQEGIDLRKDPAALQRLKEAAEKAKIELSSTTTTEINLPYITAQDGVPKHLTYSLTKAQFEKLIDPYLSRIRTCCQKALKDADLKPQDIDQLILVGGSTRVPKIQELASTFFGKKPSTGVNPDEVVALGAAIQGGILAGDLEEVVLLDVTPLSLGIETLGGVTTKLIPANTTIPTQKQQVFSTASDNQQNVEIHVLQGERPMAKDNRTLGRFTLEGLPKKPRGVPQIAVIFDIDANGILQVTAKDQETNKEQHIRIEGSSRLSTEEIERMKEDAKQHAKEDEKKKADAEQLNTADALIFAAEKRLQDDAKMAASDKEALEKVLKALRKAHELKDVSLVAQHAKELEDLLKKLPQPSAPQEPTGTTEASADDKPKHKKEEAPVDADFEEVK